jgi:hypothetical protein
MDLVDGAYGFAADMLWAGADNFGAKANSRVWRRQRGQGVEFARFLVASIGLPLR